MSKRRPDDLSKPEPILTWTWIVTEDTPSVRLDRAISQAQEQGAGTWSDPHSPLSRSQVARALDDGRVSITSNTAASAEPAKAATRISAGMTVVLRVPAPTGSELVPEERELAILYEDDAILIVNKPPGLTVHPSTTQLTGTLVHALLARSQKWSGIGGVLRPGIVHRIDKDTSGSLVIAKNDTAHRKLAETFAAHAIERTYWAIVYGEVSREPKRLETLIGRHPTDRKLMSIHVKEGRQAITHYRGLENYGRYASLVEARLETGRTHQVRVHLMSEQHSLLGDPTYGTPSTQATKWKALPRSVQKLVSALPGQALHARTLGFAHPITGEKIFVEAPLYPEMEALLTELRAVIHDH